MSENKFAGLRAAREAIIGDQSSNLTGKTDSQIDSEITSELPSVPDSKPEGQRVSKRARKSEESPVSKTASERANELANSPWRSVGLKLPGELDDWLTEKAFSLRKQGVTKQQLLADALVLLYCKMEE